ncbi:unnamed protein product [Callosobruchus maculatus]|uniref:3-hydroxyacyl-CoA dehydrogenase C-terminal domain-containing protein n=1 Tax=Callosobruchus maculatus TaxID=64391 RepID=A0A653CZL4_CALMS|nr:unnamed protein product [Callosobruchus maculatus]
MKLLEVIRTPETSHDTYTAMMEWGKSIGKYASNFQKFHSVFVSFKLFVTVCILQARVTFSGDASARDIDTAMKLGAGHPMGPIELADYVGHDTNLHILEGWHKKYPDNPLFVPCDSERELVRQGKLGVKAGEGYYKYNK